MARDSAQKTRQIIFFPAARPAVMSKFALSAVEFFGVHSPAIAR
jgi:hypothetical protein